MSWYEDGAHFHNFDARPDPSQLRTLAEKLQPHQDESTQFEALSSLCHILSMATEETLSNFNAESYLPLLGQLLNAEHNPNIMLLACRTLTHMMDVIPQTIPLAIKNEIPTSLCEKLLNIEYIDLAEQSIMALSKIAVESPNALIQSGVMTACLSYVDFFPVSVQRTSSSIVANCCRQIPKDAFGVISDSLPLISNLLHSPDSKILENACLSYSRVVERFHEDTAAMEQIISTGVISNFMNLLTSPTTNQALSPVAFVHVIRTLAFFANSSSESTISLLSEGISFVLRNMINSIIGDAPGGGSTPSKSSEQMFDILILCDQLLPPLPQTDDSSVSPKPLTQLLRSSRSPSSKTSQTDDERRTVICQHPGLISQFAENLFAPVMKAFGMNVNGSIRYKCLSIMLKIIAFSSSESLAALLMEIPISSFLASLLVLKEWTVVLLALKMADNLMQKLPSIFSVYFEKEGVFYEVESLACSAEKDSSSEREDSGESPGPATPKKGGNKASVVEKASQLHLTFRGLRSLEQAQESSSCLVILSGVAEKLKHSVDCPFEELESTIAPSLQQALDLLLERMTVSAHEVARSGFVDGLIDFLTSTRDSSDGSKMHRRKRVEIFLSLSRDSIQGTPQESASRLDRLSSLIRKVNEVVSKEERFGVFTNDFSANETGFKILSKPFHLKFMKASTTCELGDCPQSSVMIDPFAPIQSIDDFLWPLVSQKEKGEGSSRGPRRSSREARAASASEDSKGGLNRRGNPFSALANSDADEGEKSDGLDGKAQGQVNSGSGNAASSSSEASTNPDADGAKGGFSEDSHEHEQEDEHGHGEDEEEEDAEAQEENEEEEQQEDEGEGDADKDGDADRVARRAREARSALEALRKARQAFKGREQRESRNDEEVVYDVEQGSNESSSDGNPPANPPEKSLPPVLAHINKKRKLAIYLHDPETNRRSELLPQNVSFLHALQQFYLREREENSENFSVSAYWSDHHTIAYELYKDEEKSATTGLDEGSSYSYKVEASSFVFEDGLEALLSKFEAEKQTTSGFHSSLRLLSVLQYINTSWKFLSNQESYESKQTQLVPDSEFYNTGLSAKLSRQLQDFLSISSLTYPRWNFDFVPKYAFMFPFEIRRELLLSSAFGTGRSLQQFWKRTQQSGQYERKEFRPARVTKQKVRVSRDHILSSAVKIMELFGSSRLMIEVQYADEVGIGSGPTAEFYTLVSREMRKKSRKIWLDYSGKEAEFISNPKGLFPRPLNPSGEISQTIDHYRFLGKFMAKALMDSRVLDLPLSLAFYKLVLGEKLSIYDAFDIDDSLGNLLTATHKAVMQKSAILANPNYDEATKANLIGEIKMYGEEISNLALEFTFPGVPELELKVGGAGCIVDSGNVQEYYTALMDMLGGPGIQQQVNAFRAGFQQVISLQHIRLFTPSEIDILMNGLSAQFDYQSLSENLKCDHGYSLNNKAVQSFISILTEMTVEEQMAFVTFVTGSPKLPLGGLACLNPKLTIVKKLPEPGQSPDGMLPSVSTCFHYVKLPDYSSKEVMRLRLIQAIKEGQGNFHLS
eukprot:TRINITY_DN592_c0_g1_i1.p1 TRINITY_DN592_c0_g1~~TRINITY_DN592_c0_g1_i1.p1  ORF type:complete len:1552 (+),score=341.65 TRINITY_DN592_c0_g1_i1:107-4762(+)